MRPDAQGRATDMATAPTASTSLYDPSFIIFVKFLTSDSMIHQSPGGTTRSITTAEDRSSGHRMTSIRPITNPMQCGPGCKYGRTQGTHQSKTATGRRSGKANVTLVDNHHSVFSELVLPSNEKVSCRENKFKLEEEKIFGTPYRERPGNRFDKNASDLSIRFPD